MPRWYEASRFGTWQGNDIAVADHRRPIPGGQCIGGGSGSAEPSVLGSDPAKFTLVFESCSTAWPRPIRVEYSLRTSSLWPIAASFSRTSGLTLDSISMLHPRLGLTVKRAFSSAAWTFMP